MDEILYGNLRIEVSGVLGNRVERSVPVPVTAFAWQWPATVDPPGAVLGRDSELMDIREALIRRQPLEFHAPCGFGVTTLLRFVAAARPGIQVSAPYLYLKVGTATALDVARRLVSAAFTADRLVLPTPDQCASLLGQMHAVVVLDDVRCGRETLTYLLAAMPGCSLLLGSPAPHPWAVTSTQLSGLHDDAGLALLASDLGHPLRPEEVLAARRLWAASYGRPLSLRQAAALVNTGLHSLDELAAAAERGPSLLDRMSLAAVPARSRRALTVLALAGGALLPADLVAAMGNVADVRSALADLRERGLAEQESELFGLPVCAVDDRRVALLRYADAGAATRELVDWLARANPADQVSLSVAEAALSLIGFCAERGELTTVVRLVRVVEPILTLAGRWDACARALDQGLEAASRLGDLVSQAHFLHQQGTLSLCQDQLQAAHQLLQQALDIRQSQGDDQGAALTRQNLSVLKPPPAVLPPPSSRPSRVGPLVGIVVGALVLLALVVAGLANAFGGRITRSTAEPSTSRTSAPSTDTSTSRSPGNSATPPQKGLVVEAINADLGEVDVTPGSAPGSTDVTISNPNDRPVSIRSIQTTGEPFSVDKGGCGSSLDGKAQCSVKLTFAPQALGAVTGSLEVDSKVGTSTVPLKGTGYLTLKITVTVSGSGAGPVAPAGTVTDDRKRVSCPDKCSVKVASSEDAAIVLSAQAPAGTDSGSYSFTGWQGACLDRRDASTCALEMTKDTSVGAELTWNVG
jgi:hypothetical protein